MKIVRLSETCILHGQPLDSWDIFAVARLLTHVQQGAVTNGAELDPQHWSLAWASIS